MAIIKTIGKLSPVAYKQMIDHLTRKKIKNPFIKAEDIVVNKKPEIENMEAINRFVRDNPRTEKAGGGMLVQPGFGGTRQGYANGPPGKLKIQKPKMTLEKQKASASPLREDYLGQLADKRKVRTSTLNDAFEVRNVIIKNKGHVSNMEELAKKAGIFVEGKSKKVDPRKAKLALDLALDSFPELKGFQLAVNKYPDIDKTGRKFRQLDMIAKSFANYKNTKNPTEAAAHLLPDNMAMIYEYDVTKKETLGKGLFDVGERNINKNDKKFLIDRISILTGQNFNVDQLNQLITETQNVRRSEGRIKGQLKRNAKMNEQIKTLYDDKIIQNLIKGDLNAENKKKILDRAVKLTNDDVAVASRRLFQMAQAISGTRTINGITEDQDLGRKIIDTQRLIGKVGNGYAFSSLVYDHYGKVIDKALNSPKGKSFIGYYQNEIRNALDNGLVPDEIFSVTASARRGMSPYAIFTQALNEDVNSRIKGAKLDSKLSTTHRQLQEIFKGRTYDKLNTTEKKKVNDLVTIFENAKKDVLKDLKPEVRKNIQLASFDLKNPPRKAIANYASFDDNLKKAFDTSYRNVGYSMSVPKEFLTQKQLLGRLQPPGSGAVTLGALDVPSMFRRLSPATRKLVAGFGGFIAPEVLFYQLDKRNRMSKGQSEKEAAAGALESGTLGAYDNKAYMEGLKETAKSMGVDSNSFDSAYQLNLLTKNYEQNNANYEKNYMQLLEMGDEKRADDLKKNFDRYTKETQNKYALLANNISDNVMNTVGASPMAMSRGRENITQEQFEKPFFDMQDVAIEKLKREKIKASPIQKRQVDTTAGSVGEGFYQAFDSLTQGAKNLLQGRVVPFASKIGLSQYEPQASQRKILSDTLKNLSDRDLERFNLGRGYVQSDPVSALDIQNLIFEQPGLFAGGGIAKLAGVDSGPPPEKGPNSQGLPGLLKRVRNL